MHCVLKTLKQALGQILTYTGRLEFRIFHDQNGFTKCEVLQMIYTVFHLTYFTFMPILHGVLNYEGPAKSSVTNRLAWFYSRYILKLFTALEGCVE